MGFFCACFRNTNKSGVTGQGMKEAQNINKSLSALGDVIQSLVVTLLQFLRTIFPVGGRRRGGGCGFCIVFREDAFSLRGEEIGDSCKSIKNSPGDEIRSFIFYSLHDPMIEIAFLQQGHWISEHQCIPTTSIMALLSTPIQTTPTRNKGLIRPY